MAFELRLSSQMKCLWPSTISTPWRWHAKTLAVVLTIANSGVALGWATITAASINRSRQVSLAQREESLRRVPAHISEFSPVSAPLAVPKCGDIRPPEALLTPDPLIQMQDNDLHVRVSFIVGTDGRVHSAFVLDSGGANEDQSVLRAVRFWRYRPALCNGVPTDSEALVRFSIR